MSWPFNIFAPTLVTGEAMKHEKQPLPLTCLVRYSLKHCCINAYPWAYPWFSSKVPNFYPVGSFVFDHLSSVVIYQEGLVFPFCLWAQIIGKQQQQQQKQTSRFWYIGSDCSHAECWRWDVSVPPQPQTQGFRLTPNRTAWKCGMLSPAFLTATNNECLPDSPQTTSKPGRLPVFSLQNYPQSFPHHFHLEEEAWLFHLGVPHIIRISTLAAY